MESIHSGPLAPPARFERTAFRLGGGRSIHLSYGGRFDFAGRLDAAPLSND